MFSCSMFLNTGGGCPVSSETCSQDLGSYSLAGVESNATGLPPALWVDGGDRGNYWQGLLSETLSCFRQIRGQMQPIITKEACGLQAVGQMESRQMYAKLPSVVCLRGFQGSSDWPGQYVMPHTELFIYLLDGFLIYQRSIHQGSSLRFY